MAMMEASGDAEVPKIASFSFWIPLDCGGQAPHTWHDDLCGFLKLCFNAVWTG